MVKSFERVHVHEIALKLPRRRCEINSTRRCFDKYCLAPRIANRPARALNKKGEIVSEITFIVVCLRSPRRRCQKNCHDIVLKSHRVHKLASPEMWASLDKTMLWQVSLCTWHCLAKDANRLKWKVRRKMALHIKILLAGGASNQIRKCFGQQRCVATIVSPKTRNL